MRLDKIGFRTAVGVVLLWALGMALLVNLADPVENYQLVMGVLYGQMALIAGVAAAFGYRQGRWPAPGQPHPAARRAVFGILAVVLCTALFIAGRVVFDGISVSKAIGDLAESLGRTGMLVLLPGLIGYVIGRMARNGQTPART